ncbi:MAG: tRNA epoxyqueuosine(34) reductase QueG [Akkermansiaceae bacterium]|nr:tRNA epoxyqueuosine(34) reductase QueG [Akkermansiaceae bacterium]
MTPTPQAARQAAEYAATALGFSALGVAPARLPQGDYLQQWLADGQHADMVWMERHLPARQNPALVLPGVRSVIMLTYEYAAADARQAPGRIARYAQGEDYHKLLAGKLADIDETLSLYGGVQRCFTDSGPVSERFFAAQAGLGWIGRNGLLIRPKHGSYCFLATILTTLELPYDTPIPNRCGTCHRCEQACPTAALNNGRCDARRCIAYWTIEAKAPTPQHITQAATERIYGCDICQEACPWNRAPHHRPPTDLHLLMPARLSRLAPEQLAALPEQEFEQLFAGSPIRRIGSAHWAHNLSGLVTPCHTN